MRQVGDGSMIIPKPTSDSKAGWRPDPVNLKVSLYFKGAMKPTFKKACQETHYMAFYRKSSSTHSLKDLCLAHYKVNVNTLKRERCFHLYIHSEDEREGDTG